MSLATRIVRLLCATFATLWALSAGADVKAMSTEGWSRDDRVDAILVFSPGTTNPPCVPDRS